MNTISTWIERTCPECHDRWRGLRHLLRDRDSKYTRAFGAVFAVDGIKILKTAPQGPRMNGHA